MEVREWPFKSINNNLLVIFGAQVSDENSENNGDNENCNDYVTSEDASGNLNWISLYFNGVVMYPKIMKVKKGKK